MNTPSPADAVLAVLPKTLDECWETTTLHDWLRTVCPALRLTLEDVEAVARGMERDGLVECSEITDEPGNTTVALTAAGIAAANVLPQSVTDAVQRPKHEMVYTGILNWRITAALNRMTNSKPDDLAFTAGMALGLADGLYAAGGIGDSEWRSANLHMMHIWRTRKGTDQVANS